MPTATGYKYPYYVLCEQGNDIDRKHIYQTCFNHVLHKEYEYGEPQYFLQFKAAALTSVVEFNKVEHSEYKKISTLLTYLNKGNDTYEWSMMRKLNAGYVL